jgi:RNA recognition motif-containing protein
MLDFNNKSRGFGFVVFAEKEQMDIVLRLHHILDNKTIECKPAFPKGTEKEPSSEDVVYYNNKIFIGGLSDLKEEVISDYFSKFGVVDKVTLMREKYTNKPRGFGFVIFKDDEATETVLSKPQHFIDGKQVECKRSFRSTNNNHPSSSSLTYTSSKISDFYSTQEYDYKRDDLTDCSYSNSNSNSFNLSDYFNFKLNDKNAKPMVEEFKSFGSYFNETDDKCYIEKGYWSFRKERENLLCFCLN